MYVFFMFWQIFQLVFTQRNEIDVYINMYIFIIQVKVALRVFSIL